jgi:hypothetical protein
VTLHETVWEVHLFQGCRGRRQLGRVDLLMMEATAQRHGYNGDDGKCDDGAHH